MAIPWTDPKTSTLVEGSSTNFTLTFRDATALSSVSSKVYRGNQDVSSDWLTNSDSASANVMTTKTLTVPTGSAGKTYVFEMSAVVDSARTEKRWHEVR